MGDEVTYSITEINLRKIHDYIESQVAKELERVFDLGDSNMTNEEQAVLISYKAQQVAVNTINAIEKGDIF